MNLGEHSAGRSIFGTNSQLLALIDVNVDIDILMNPSLGLAESGSAISALIPQTIVVSPILINADPSAVDTDPRHQP